ncbi:MAG TPA: type II toxin-antitoxin system RelE/ParE family toxin [Pirellulales bacterium]|nr:type II toxin-antitoxin system RelE/ParE family toxin [Pirellulales bacterium]
MKPRWLREIHDYIAQDNPPAAKRTIYGIYHKVQLLKQFPEFGYRYEHDEGRGIRIILYGHYRIAYLVKTSSDIDILGVFHAALDIERLL